MCVDVSIEVVSYVPVRKGHCLVQQKLLDFLPEKVVVMTTVGGFLCCRNCVYEASASFKKRPHVISPCMRNCQKRLVIYVCNPATKKWTSLGPGDCPVGDVFGLVLSHSSSPNSFLNFKLVSIMRLKEVPNAYAFAIYSSERQSWKISKEVRNCSSNIYGKPMIFVKGRFHWLTHDHHVVVFHVEEELSSIIKLPGVTPDSSYKCRMGICLGESGGDFHYVCAHLCEVQVWKLKSYFEPSWMLKHQLPLAGFIEKLRCVVDNPNLLPQYFRCPPCEHFNPLLEPLAFHDEVLFMRTGGSVISYNFSSGDILHLSDVVKLGLHFYCRPTVLPYCITLASLDGFGNGGALFENNCIKDSKEEANNSRKRNQQMNNPSKGRISYPRHCERMNTLKS